MDNLAHASINSLPSPAMQVDSAQPAFLVTSAQLKDILQEATQPLQDRIEALEATIAHLQEENAALAATQDTLSENQLIQLNLINQLREAAKKEAQPMQADRGEILRALLAANGGKMLAKEARAKMRLSKQSFSNLLTTVRDVSSRPYHLDKRQIVLSLE